MTIADDIVRLTAQLDRPLTMAELYAIRPGPIDHASFVRIVCDLADSGQIKRYPAPAHSGSGVRFVYGVGE